MKRRLWLAILAVFLGSPGVSSAAPAETASHGDRWFLCQTAAARHERQANIPRHLLGAIAVAESGRWHAGRAENLAWPWTVMAEGRGRFFDTKAQAVDAVQDLRGRGITNIDVGCMQINLRHHADAFDSLDTAFDPAANVAYGAAYLAAKFAETRSWHRAAGRYHSATPEFERPYRLKVLALWNERRRLARTATHEGGRRPNAAIDHGRTEALNARLRTNRARGRAAGSAGGPAATATTDWRQRRPRAEIDLRHEKIVAEVMRTQRRLGIRGPRAERTFAERRRSQLDRWRVRRVPTAPDTGL